jgi:hypothetical protein
MTALCNIEKMNESLIKLCLINTMISTESIHSSSNQIDIIQNILSAEQNSDKTKYDVAESKKYRSFRLYRNIASRLHYFTNSNLIDIPSDLIDIPSDLFVIIEKEIIIHNLIKSNITVNFLELMLRKHRFRNYYDNIPQIYSKITGRKLPTLSPIEHELVIEMYFNAKHMYESKHQPAHRKGLVKISFILHKILLIINHPDIAIFFKTFANEFKVQYHEILWKNICTDLNWIYHPD